MPQPAKVQEHLTIAELEQRFKTCRNPAEKIHYQVIYLRSMGLGTTAVAQICGYKKDWVRRLVRRYNTQGPDVLVDARQNNGRECLLTDEQQQELRRAVLTEEPPGGGLWTGPKVAQWMAEKTGLDIWPQLAWDYLKRLGLSKQSPRPKHPKSSPEEQAAFKKNSADA